MQAKLALINRLFEKKGMDQHFHKNAFRSFHMGETQGFPCVLYMTLGRFDLKKPTPPQVCLDIPFF